METDQIESPQVQLIRWEAVPTHKVSDAISLQVVWGEKATLARFCFAKGTHTPPHKHEAEQHTYLVLLQSFHAKRSENMK